MTACMNRALIAELEKLDADERLRLAYDLLDQMRSNRYQAGWYTNAAFAAGTVPDITPDKTRHIFEEIERRWGEGEPFSSRPNSDRHILPWLEKQGLRKRVARSILSDWLTNQMLRSETYSAKTKAKGLKVVKWPG